MDSSATPTQLHAAADRVIGTTTQSAGLTAANLRRPLVLAFLIALFNQLSGINAVLYLALRIFEMAGPGAESALLQSIGIGVTNLIFTFVGLWLIDRAGRKTLLFVGSVGYVISLGRLTAHERWPMPDHHPTFSYSYRKASIGSRREAFQAG
ncbi:MAG: MFS transporter [Pirellulales bacterium]